MKSLISNILRRLGYSIRRNKAFHDELPGLSESDRLILKNCHPYSLITPEKMYANLLAINYLVSNNIVGSLAECGVWRGGSMMAMMMQLIRMRDEDRRCYLFDTFTGMSPPADRDRSWYMTSEQAAQQHESGADGSHNSWCFASMEEVLRNVSTTSYPQEMIQLVKGDVAKTLVNTDTGPLALLRLDTDFYASTKIEMEVLFPRLVPGGVLILDDYGSWEGSREAVDEYISENNIRIFLHRIDRAGRIAVK